VKGGGLFALFLPPTGEGEKIALGTKEAISLFSRGVHGLTHRGRRIVSFSSPNLPVPTLKGLEEEEGKEAVGGDSRKPFVGQVGAWAEETTPVQFANGAQGALALVLAEEGGWIDTFPLGEGRSGTGAVAYLGRLESGEAESVRSLFLGRSSPHFAPLASPYAAVLLEQDGLYAVRDVSGVFPLFVGRKGDLVALASETSPLETLGFSVSEVRAGQLNHWRWTGNEVRYIPRPFPKTEQPIMRATECQENPLSCGVCAFELLYISRPDSRFFGMSLYTARKRLGEELARLAPAEADMVVYAPDTAFPQALGYAQTLGLPLEGVLVKSPAAPRSFLLAQKERDLALEAKFALVQELVQGKRLVLVDDSLVYGSTAVRLLKLLWDAGARAVHVRIAAPPVTTPCVYGFFGPTSPPMAEMSREGLAAHIGADTLAYLEPEVFLKLFPQGSVCTACFASPERVARL